MKKIMIFSVLTVLLFASCKKNRICECINIDNGEVNTSNIVDQTKSSAKNICGAKSNAYRNCELK